MKTGLYLDSVFLRHETGLYHPERAMRLTSVEERLKQDPGLKGFELRKARKAERWEIALLHAPHYIEQFASATWWGQKWFGSEDCTISENTYEAACHAVGCVIDAVTEVAANHLDNAFCAVRPPGHHAERNKAMGFCFFNNVALGAEFLVSQLGFKRVLIFDFDVHHGNGTQHLFEERSDVFYASIHQDPKTCYPGTGYEIEQGKGPGLGYTLNCPMPPHSEDVAYLEKFETRLLPAFHEYKPDFVMISAGFDAHKDDPLANINLSRHCFDTFTVAMKKIADQYAGGKLVSVLEGGYSLNALAECVSSHVTILKDGPSRIPHPSLKEIIQEVWKRWHTPSKKKAWI
ncbi:MAG: histone deacetylase [SAR324 cluster bacterium]|nr:histone deacetylase [SAR324 cluster bacterium]